MSGGDSQEDCWVCGKTPEDLLPLWEEKGKPDYSLITGMCVFDHDWSQTIGCFYCREKNDCMYNIGVTHGTHTEDYIEDMKKIIDKLHKDKIDFDVEIRPRRKK